MVKQFIDMTYFDFGIYFYEIDLNDRVSYSGNII